MSIAASSPVLSQSLAQRYRAVRAYTEKICEPLAIEDYVIQPEPDVSPPKWHLGHTTWFFESFLLKRFIADYTPHHPRYEFLFNSYYESVGQRVARPQRGLLSRPTVAEVLEYRHAIDNAMSELFTTLPAENRTEFESLVEIGLHHEQQHQELLFTDLKNILFRNPLLPVYLPQSATPSNNHTPLPSLQFRSFPEGMVNIGVPVNDEGFAYDNESPEHRVFLNAFEIAERLITCGEYFEFVRDGGYRDFRHWLSDGWTRVCAEEWHAPLYWLPLDDAGDGTSGRPFVAQSLDEYRIFTLGGLREIDPNEPVSHISYYEAAAFASWQGMRLPTEAEWETAARTCTAEQLASANVAGTHAHGVPYAERYHPAALAEANAGGGLLQMFGDVWEWTGSAYLAYPGYRSLDGALGEYNGKFMSDQMVLRGGSCATPFGHIRRTYRNFFQPYQRWQFSGLRLARDEHV